MIRLQIKENDTNQRLDRFVRKYLKNAPLSFIYKFPGIITAGKTK